MIWVLFSSLLFAWHFFNVIRFAVDVPIADEWDYFNPSHGEIFSWDWITAFHNEHRILPTKILAWLNYELFQLNFVYQKIFNFLLYGVLVWVFFKLLLRLPIKTIYFLPFLPFLLSDISHDSHAVALQSCFHFMLLFAFLSLLFLSRFDWLGCVAGAVALVLSIWSLSGGVAIGLTVGALYVFHEFLNRRQFGPAWFFRSFIFLVILAAGLLAWSVGYATPSHHPQFVGPWDWRFWAHLGASLSYAIGSDGINYFMWGLALLLTLATGFGLSRNYFKRKDKEAFVLLAIFSLLLATASVIALSRAGFHIHQGKSSRYAEITIFLLPIFSITMATVWQKPKWVLFFWIFCLANFANNFNFPKRYQAHFTAHEEARRCTLENPEGPCPTAYPGNYVEQRNLAKSLGASLFRQSSD